MDALLAAIYTLYGDTAALTALTSGGLHLYDASHAATAPYMILTPVAQEPEYYCGGITCEQIVVQFTIVTDDASGVTASLSPNQQGENIYTQLIAAFDDTSSLSVTGSTVMRFWRTSVVRLPDPDEGAGHLIHVDYAAWLS